MSKAWEDPADPRKLELIEDPTVTLDDPEYITPPGVDPTDNEQEEFDRMWLEGDTITEDGYTDHPDDRETSLDMP